MASPEKETPDIGAEYETWKKNCPLMYSFVSETTMTWPSLTFDWCGYREDETAGMGIHRALAGTFSQDKEEKEKIVLMESTIPLDLGDLGKTGANGRPADLRFRTVKEWAHDGEPNKIKSCGDLMASINGEGTIFVRSISGDVDETPITLKEHTTNAFGLDWSVGRGGAGAPEELVSGGEDGKVILWNLESKKPSWNVSTSSVNDVQCHKTFPYIIGAALEEGFIALFDTRASETTGATLTRPPSGDKPTPYNCVAFSPHSEYLFAAGSSESTVNLYDIRNTGYRLHSLSGHNGAVTGIQFDPFHSQYLATGGQDRRVIIWNMNTIGCEQSQDDAEDASPELYFMHGGHTAPVSAFAYNPEMEWCLGSVSEDNIAQIWGVSDKIYNPTELEVVEGTLE